MEPHSRSRSNSRASEMSPGKDYKVKRENRHRMFKNYLTDYTVNSNLHGLKYIGEKERTTIEKYFWIFMFTCGAVLCTVLIRMVYIKWENNPVIVSFDEKATPTWQIPYPAVTICFESKSLQSHFNFTKYFHIYNGQSDIEWKTLTPEECRLYEDSTLVCSNPNFMVPGNDKKFGDGKTIVQHLRQVSPNISDYFYGCKWKEISTRNCADLFSPILTDDGHCYTFNTLSFQELYKQENLHKEYIYLESNKSSQGWSLQNGYPSSTPAETYPYRGIGHGLSSGLTIHFEVNKNDLDYICKGAEQGFKILLHNPAELPRLTEQFIRIPLSQAIYVAVKPKMMTTSNELKSYKTSQRQCHFSEDRYLRYFKIYTQNNCEIECLTNFTYARCDCVHWSMPHSPEMKVCHAGSGPCLRNAQNDFAQVAIQSNKERNPNDILEKASTIASKCNCLPACTSIEYEAEISQANFDAKGLFKAFGWKDEEGDTIYSAVRIFFKEAQFIGSRRSELYGLTDFLANCGGVLGLCMGFSILSVAEIVYFLTLRIIMYRRRNSEKMINLSV